MKPKLSKTFRDALDEKAPDAREARDDFARVVKRIDGRRSSPRLAVPLLAAAVVATVGALYWTRRETPLVIELPPPTGEPLAKAVTRPRSDVVAYIRKNDEPESAALSFQMTQGDR